MEPLIKTNDNVCKTQKQKSLQADPSVLSDSCFEKSICSSTDCTGLIPALPTSDAELEAYEEMYAFCNLRTEAATPRPADSQIQC